MPNFAVFVCIYLIAAYLGIGMYLANNSWNILEYNWCRFVVVFFWLPISAGIVVYDAGRGLFSLIRGK